MKKYILILTMLPFISCQTHEDCDNQIIGLKIYSDSLIFELVNKEKYIDELKNGIDLREGEISMIGHELDSFKYKLKK